MTRRSSVMMSTSCSVCVCMARGRPEVYAPVECLLWTTGTVEQERAITHAASVEISRDWGIVSCGGRPRVGGVVDRKERHVGGGDESALQRASSRRRRGAMDEVIRLYAWKQFSRDTHFRTGHELPPPPPEA